MANNVTLPASGTGDVNPKASTDQVSSDSSQVQNVQLAAVAGGVLTRNPTIPVSLATNTPIEVRATTGAAPTAFTSTSSAQIFASNAARKLFTVYNNSDKDLYLIMASAAASATSFHVIVKAAGGYFSTTDYSGEIRGIMAAAIGTGQVNCGEFT